MCTYGQSFPFFVSILVAKITLAVCMGGEQKEEGVEVHQNGFLTTAVFKCYFITELQCVQAALSVMVVQACTTGANI